MVEELCASQAMSRIQLDLFFLCWVVFFPCVWHFFNVDTRLWTVFKIHVLCVRFYMCLSFLQKREDICHRHGGTHPVTSVSFFSFCMGLRLELYGAQYSLSVTRRPPLGTRCCHHQYCSHKTAEVVVCICMHCGHTQHPSRCCTCHALFLHTLVVRVYHIGHDWSFWFVVCLEAHSYVCTCRDVCVHWRFTLLKHSSA